MRADGRSASCPGRSANAVGRLIALFRRRNGPSPHVPHRSRSRWRPPWGAHALIAIGFNLQYGVARIVNLAYGEFLMGAAFAAFWMLTLLSISPILGMLMSVPATFGANWLVYRALMLPLVRRARTREQLEGETILATFGLLFVLRGAASIAFSANNRYYDYLGVPLNIFGFTFAANRVLAFAVACLFGLLIWVVLMRTRFGAALRALAIDPIGAHLVGADVTGCRPRPSPSAARWWR